MVFSSWGHVFSGLVLGGSRGRVEDLRFGGRLVFGSFKCGKLSHHQNEKFFTNNLMRDNRVH